MQWQAWLLNHEMEVRLSFFFGVFAIMAFWEWRKPCRTLKLSKWLRWRNNLGLVFLNTLVLRALFPAAAVGVAFYAEQQGLGLFNIIGFTGLLSIIVSVILLDMLIYMQHVAFHKVPILWRLHRVHHADPDYDVTTGARFHPIEIVLSMLIKCSVILLLGPAAVAVIIFEVLLNGSAMFNHSNIRLPAWLDPIVRAVFVTPDMHRVHHSQIPCETDSNYGFALSWWDRIFSTYNEQPQKGQLGMDIGLKEYPLPEQNCKLPGLLMMPFRK